MVYSLASDVKSFRVCNCYRIVHTVLLFSARPPTSHGKHLCLHCLFSVTVPGGWLPLTGLSWIPYAFGLVALMAPPSFLGAIPPAHLLLMSHLI